MISPFIHIRAISLNNISNGSSGLEEEQSYGRPVRHLFAYFGGWLQDLGYAIQRVYTFCV